MSRQAVLAPLYFIIPIIVLIAANAEVFTFLLSKWFDFDHGAYNHGLLLIVIVFYYLWKNISPCYIGRIHWLGIVLSISLIGLVFAANIVHVASVQVAALYFFLWSLIFVLFGREAIKASFWPLVLLAFSLPLWDGVGILLQKLTLEASYFMVHASGIPVFKDGFQIIIPPGRFEVAPGCSGLSYFLAAASLAVIYAMMNYRSQRHYVIVVGSIIIASIVANWIRVYIVIMAGYFTDMKHALVEDHFNLGWFLFGVFFIVLLIIFNKKLHVQDHSQESAEAMQAHSGLNSGLNAGISVNEKSGKNMPITFSVLLSVIVVMFAYVSFVNNKQVSYQPDEMITDSFQVIHSGFPVLLGQQHFGAQEKYYAPRDTGTEGKYKGIIAYEAFYEKQIQGQELVQDSNLLYNKEDWNVDTNTVLSLTRKGASEKAGSIGRLALHAVKSGEQVVLFYWYYIDGKRTVSAKEAKIYELASFVGGNKSAMLYIVLATDNVAAQQWYKTINRN